MGQEHEIEMSATDRLLQELRERMSKHSTSLFPIGVALAFTTAIGLRLLVVANLDPQTALAILQYRGTGDVAVGVAVTSIPWFLVGFALLFVAASSDASNRLFLVMFVLALLTLVFVPLMVIVLATCLLGLILAVSYLERSGRHRRSWLLGKGDWGEVRRLVVTVGAIVVFLVAPLLDPRPWMPAEQVTVRGRSLVGYVLSESDGRTVIMRHSDRRGVAV